MKTIVAIALCLLLGLSSYAAENENYKFRPLSPEGGFYYDGVKQIEQDKLGFIWVMMENELYRFDGYQYKKYRPYFNNLLPGAIKAAYAAEALYPELFEGYGDEVAQRFIDEGYSPLVGQTPESLCGFLTYQDYLDAGGEPA